MIGNPIPKHFFGFSFNLEYQGFDINANFQGVGGNDIHYGYHYINRGMATTLNKETWILDRWRSEAEPGNGIVPRAIIGDPTGNNRTSTLQVYPGGLFETKTTISWVHASAKSDFKYRYFQSEGLCQRV
jgi:TonB-dependent starch-binding outer membrane protein SusC